MNLCPTPRVINTIQVTINEYIWNSKPAKIKAKILQQNITEGCLTLPNILKYYQAAPLVTIAQWWMRKPSAKDSCFF